MDLSLPTADTVVHNSRVLFANQCSLSCNKIVRRIKVGFHYPSSRPEFTGRELGP